MTLTQAQHTLDDFLTKFLARFDYSRTEPLIYSRPMNEAMTSLAFPCRIDSNGKGCFTINVWLRFDSIQRHTDSSSTQLRAPTVSMPLHLLITEGKFSEWSFREPAHLEEISANLTESITKYAIPFSEKYSNLLSVRKTLESEDPKNWFILDPEQRIAVLATIQYVQGDRLGAISTLDRALLDRKTASPKKRSAIEALRRHLLQPAER